jgi:hypothetical protein
VGKNAQSQAAAAVGYNVVEHADDEGRDPIRAGMTKSECHGHDRNRKSAKVAELYLLEISVDHKPQHKGAPKNFLHHRNNNQTKKTNRLPITSNSQHC